MSRDIYEACEAHLADWDRQAWMQDHGEWASEAWAEERMDYDDAVQALRHAAQDLPDSDRVTGQEVLNDVRDALAMVSEMIDGLDGQISSPKEDYIAEGTIDPDGVAGEAQSLDVGDRWQGWDCTEGWSAYRHGDALYVRWWRDASGNRHDRDLWVMIEEDFFEDEDEEASDEEG